VKVFQALLIGVALLGFAAPPASGAEQAMSRVPTVTRLVKLFLEREETLSSAMQRGDAAAMGASLADDFELRTGERAADPVPRNAFIASVVAARPRAGAISRMAVHDLGGVMIVSFVDGDAPNDLFVVDVWRPRGSDWMLAIRYAGPVRAPRIAVPGADAAEPVIPKKY
jgi:hypothetical protein